MEAREVKQDGRHLRVERSRSHIIEAMLELIRETGEVPTADVLAERADVSRRSVFRLFEDRAALLRSAFDQMYTIVLERFPFPDLSDLSPRDKLRGVIDYAGAIYEFIAPYRRVGDSLTGDHTLIKAERDRFQAAFGGSLRSTFREIFPAAAASNQVVRDSLRAAMSWNTWSFLRYDCGRSVEHTKAVVLHNVSTILAAAGADL